VTAYGVAPPGYRLPAATRLGAVKLQVADLERSLAWYDGVLGLSVRERDQRSAVLVADGDKAPLIHLEERSGASPVPRRGRLGLYHFAILLPERAALGRFVTHLAAAGISAGMSDHLVSEAVYLTDPDGLGIEVYADRPRETWQHDGRQLAMASNPLDVTGLMRVAGSAEWNGMPTGTVIGHVHLHVGDIEMASRFYHEGLGLDKTVWSYPGALFLAAGGYHHHLGTNTWAAGAAPAAEGDARLLEWQVIVPDAGDAGRAIESLAAGGAAVLRDANGGVARDPWGTAVRVAGQTD